MNSRPECWYSSWLHSTRVIISRTTHFHPSTRIYFLSGFTRDSAIHVKLRLIIRMYANGRRRRGSKAVWFFKTGMTVWPLAEQRAAQRIAAITIIQKHARRGAAGNPFFVWKPMRRIRASRPVAATPGAFTFARMNIVIASAIVRALPPTRPALSLRLSFALVAHSARCGGKK